ncbi:MAG: RloB domain-containing protein [Candidatus Parabeggiatoa sp. nov. 3]|nr:MAG: RloB domain-containing protein [Gammaproteobacteria bacterium]RKZ54674.1 MAG: RloB domain-containing protein [Gammaproteobacteria bacterium]RKZ78765.1 MAG: RloB domain-containing protein [Gammaproteobacteria bacterium]
MARRKLPKTPSLERRKSQREPKFKIVVVCEGEKTEPKYLNDFTQDHNNPLVEIKVVPKGGVPVTLVKKAVKFKKELEREARRSQNSFDEHFQVWGLFDVDEHPNIPQAKDMARSNGVKLSIANPCFELWGLLHIRNYDAPIHRHDLQRILEKLMQGYDHEVSATFNYEFIRDHYDIAKKRAKQGYQRREEEGDSGGNPSTDVHKLLDLIIDSGKNSF